MDKQIEPKNLHIHVKKYDDRAHDDIWWYNGEDPESCGFGYRIKATGLICINRCPMCEQENYAINRPTGTCASCGFNPNK
jgi:hypothetical protein